ncbi:MAG TPA: hypothetical protein PKN22_01960 [Taishania sp.]|nr:hypothetical protein [Taishania sp.]HNS41496.1 hypothetical protein [Taishania sp.]
MNEIALKSVASLVGLSEISITSGNNEQLFEALSNYLNHLIEHDFNQLVAILYRVDVSEEKVRQTLANAPKGSNSGKLIAQLILEREQQKMYWREKYKKGEI